jgi:hypothetical protein
MQKPQKIHLKRIQKLEPILSLHRCRKTFFGFFYRFISAGKLFSVFSIASSVQENFFLVFSIASLVQENFFWFFLSLHRCRKTFFRFFSIASSVKKTLPFKIVSLYSIFFSKIVCQYRFNRYTFDYRCPSLPVSLPVRNLKRGRIGKPCEEPRNRFPA